jgi:DNA topoisomerase-3
VELIIAEKPSVGRTIAAVLGANEAADGYLQGRGMIVTWCVGHLVELAMPEDYRKEYAHWRYQDLPIIPEKWKYNISRESAKQFGIVSSLMKDDRVDGIICATDAGREGELIFRLAYQAAGCRKPVRRLWISSMEESAIREGFHNMKSMSAYDNLYQAALCRAQADWLIGMNATRLYSLLYGTTLHIGRVMTPTLAMLTERENSIDNFHPESFYVVKLDLGNGCQARSERIHDLSRARALMDACNRSNAVIKRVERRRKAENPPLLYDLTSLQRDANRVFGFTAQQTLEYAQSLYEKRLLTYPRTDSRYLTHNAEPGLRELASRVNGTLPFTSGSEITADAGRVINDQKVTDHHAIIPTETMPSQNVSLPDSVADLLNLVCVRLLCALGQPCVREETTVTVECAGSEFQMKTRKMLEPGWQRIWQAFRESIGNRVPRENEPDEDVREMDLPGWREGDEVPFPRAELTEGKTTPPAHHTEDTILHAMETAGVEDMPEDAEHKGIGTPATRASILEKLLETKLVERTGDRRKRVLIPTAKGKALASVLPARLCSAQLTADWEQRLKRIENGEEKAEDFMRDIRAYVQELIQDTTRAENADELFTPMRQKICACPRCGAAITDHSKGFMCENRICGFVLWKTGGILKGAEHPLTASEVKALVENGSVLKKGLVSAKSHIKYDATLHLDYNKNGKPVLRPTFD